MQKSSNRNVQGHGMYESYLCYYVFLFSVFSLLYVWNLNIFNNIIGNHNYIGHNETDFHYFVIN